MPSGAAQLGLSVTVVEKNATMGGTCLNIGCIPSKALLDSSEHFDLVKNGLSRHGIGVGAITLDLAVIMERKTGIVATLTKGIASLLKALPIPCNVLT